LKDIPGLGGDAEISVFDKCAMWQKSCISDISSGTAIWIHSGNAQYCISNAGDASFC
jgi:hypothetical protein